MRVFLVWVVTVVVIVGCGSNGKLDGNSRSVTISGKVGFPKEGKITIKSWSDTSGNVQVLDFDKKANTFKGTVKFSEPGFYRINFFGTQDIDVILDKSDLQINVDGSSQTSFFEVLGSPDVDLFQRVDAIQNRFKQSPELRKINSDFNSAVNSNDLKTVEALQAKYQQLAKASNDSISILLIQSAPSVGVIEELNRQVVDPDQYFNTYEKVASKLTGDWAKYKISREFLEVVSKMKKLSIGQVAPEIELPNPEGKLIKLSSLRGKYVLVDFWAKWCGPCRRENPNVVAAYKKYNSKGFEVFGVSLDKTKEDWVQAINEDGLTWTQVSDLKYFNSEAARLYNISAIPFSILLDKDGVIVAKNLRGADLDKKLRELFGS